MRNFTCIFIFLLSISPAFALLTTPALTSPAIGSQFNSPNATLDWSASTGATGYEYKLSTNASLTGATTQTVTGTSQVVTANLFFGTTYYWQVRAIKTTAPIDSSAWSAIFNFTTINQLSHVSPANGALYQDPNALLDWTGISGITNYDYQWDTVNTFNSPLSFYSSVGATSQVNASNLRFGTTYYWRVRARHAADTSAWTAPWSFTVIENLTHVSPANGALYQDPNVLLDWTGIAGITNYDYQWDTVNTFNSPLSFYNSVGATSQVNASNLRFGTTYYWRVRARHAADTSAWSAPSSFTVIENLTHVSPANGALYQDPNVLLDWTGIAGITNYDYQWDTVNTFNSPISFYNSVGATSQVNASNLRFGTTYYWRVRARHAADTSAWSAPWSFTVIENLTHVSPANNALYQDPNALLDWTGIAGITNYDYQWDTVNTFNSPISFYNSVGATSQVNASNLRFGTTYYWRVRARHAADTSAWSAPWSFTVIENLTHVSPANGALYQTPNVLLDWTGIAGITNYDYQWDTVNTFNSPLSFYSSVGATSQVNASNLRFGTTYYWRVRARHATDTSAWSAPWSFTVLEYLTHVSPANGATGVSLNPTIDWTGITGINGYEYRYSTSSNFSSSTNGVLGAVSQANLTSLSYGTQYFWQVRTFHASDTSEWSVMWNFTTLYQLTAAPTLISPANTSSNIPVSGTPLQWSSVSGATLYEFQYDDDPLFGSPVVNQTAALNDNTGTLIYGTTYYWRVRASNGSGYSPWSGSWEFNTEISTTINEAQNSSVLSIYPNPSGGVFTISATSALQNIEIFNADGELVSRLADPNQSAIIDLSAFAKGIYFIRIISNEKNVVRKIVVE